MDNIKTEARRILNSMAGMAAYHGTTSTAVVDYMCQEWGDTVFCHGHLRQIVFTPITANSCAFKTTAMFSD
jgi:hypothetical protein